MDGSSLFLFLLYFFAVKDLLRVTAKAIILFPTYPITSLLFFVFIISHLKKIGLNAHAETNIKIEDTKKQIILMFYMLSVFIKLPLRQCLFIQYKVAKNLIKQTPANLFLSGL